MSEADINKYRVLLLQRMRAKWGMLPDYQRNLPAYRFQDPHTLQEVLLTPNEAIREVEMMSEIGKRIIAAEIAKLQRLNP